MVNNTHTIRSHYSCEVTSELEGKNITLAGWVHEIRDLGNIKFLVLRDRYGIIQLTAKKGETPDSLLSLINELNRESVIKVEGRVVASSQAPGGREVIPSQITLLNPALSPLPLDVTGKVSADLDTRLNNRFMDVRRPEVAAIFIIRSKIQEAFREYFLSNDFIEINTPTIIAAASEGGTNLFPLSYFEREAYLCQSPQLYKQMMMASGLDKVFITTPVFRAESHNTTRHLNEVFQMDIEKAFIRDEEDVLIHLEEVVHFIYKKVKEECKNELAILGREIKVPKLPFTRITYDEVLDKLADKGMDIPWGEDLSTEAQKLICREIKEPFFIKHWPTHVRSFYSRPLDDDPKRCGAFDLMFDGIELASGAQRIHEEKELVRQLENRGLNPENFEFYLKAFRYGMPPHGGWSIGAERITQVITGMNNIRETVLYPRDRTRLTP